MSENHEGERAARVHRTIEQVARDSYGRLLAFLAVRCRDVSAAEDALADAFQTALETWPRNGIPEKPEAWLLVAGRRKLIDGMRRSRIRGEAIPDLLAGTENAYEMAGESLLFPDERLKLMFVCAHPAIEAQARTPLMLQTVLGLDAARIASAFLVRPSAMGQRLTRAKSKIRVAGIRFEVPEAAQLPERLEFVLEAIYAAYGSGWDDITGADARRKGLAAEAVELARVLVQLMPDEPEPKGLLAMMLHCEARREARRTQSGSYVPLLEQDVTCWSKEMMGEAERLLCEASRRGRIGRFQLEAAIQSAHAQRARTGVTDWNAIALLYEGLVRLSPTVGALVGRAAVIAEAQGPAAGLSALELLPDAVVQTYQPYWALAGHLFKRLGRISEAQCAYSRAIGLSEEPALRRFLEAEISKSDERDSDTHLIGSSDAEGSVHHR